MWMMSYIKRNAIIGNGRNGINFLSDCYQIARLTAQCVNGMKTILLLFELIFHYFSCSDFSLLSFMITWKINEKKRWEQRRENFVWEMFVSDDFFLKIWIDIVRFRSCERRNLAKSSSWLITGFLKNCSVRLHIDPFVWVFIRTWLKF